MKTFRLNVLLAFILSINNVCYLSNAVCTDSSKVTIFAYYRELKANEELIVQPNERLALVCCHPNKAIKLEWFDDSAKEVIELRDSNTPKDKTKYAFIDEKERLPFIISNVTRKDNSTFKCRLKGGNLEAAIKLKVGHDLPNTKVEEKFQIFAKGQPIKLECPHESFLHTPIMWFYYTPTNTKGVRLMSDGATKYANVTDGRKYFYILDSSNVPKSVFCRLQSQFEIGGIYKKKWIKISWQVYTPVSVKVSVSPNNEVYEGSRAEIVCKYDVIPKSQQIVNWLIDNKKYHSFPTDFKEGRSALIIKKFSAKIGKTFTCNVISNRKINGLSKTTSSSQSLVPTYIPKPQIVNTDHLSFEVEKGGKTTMRCQVKNADNKPELFKKGRSEGMSKVNPPSGDTNYKLIYTKESKDPNSYGDLLYTIEKTKLTDRGVYVCSVSNKAGLVTANGTLTVISEPVMDSGYRDKVVYFYQQQISVNCIVKGYPLETRKNNLVFELAGKIINNRTNVNERSLLNVTFWVKLDPKQESYTGYCIYNGKKKTLREAIQFKVAPLPPAPEISLVCSGTTEAVFKAKKVKLDKDAPAYKNIVREYYTIKMKNIQSSKSATGVSEDRNVFIDEKESHISISPLKHSTEYVVEWSWTNTFARIDSLSFDVMTKAPTIPEPVSDIEVWSAKDPPRLIVAYMLRSKCIRAKVPDVNKVRIRVKSSESKPWIPYSYTIDNKKWEEAGRGNKLQAEVTVDNINMDYIVEVAAINNMGDSQWVRTKFEKGMIGPSNQGYNQPGAASNLSNLSLGTLLTYLCCLGFVQKYILLRHY